MGVDEMGVDKIGSRCEVGINQIIDITQIFNAEY